MEKKTIDREFVKNRLQKMTRSSTIKWGRSKIMIVGEGRAGKSALANSLLGKTFAPTESTVGIKEFSCRIGKFTGSAEDRTERNRYDKADKELEMLVAKSLKAEFEFLLAENIIEDKLYTESLIEGYSKEEIDEETVWRCLQNEIMMSTKYLLSIFDFGGQSVFNVIHPFFLTSYGVYLVVFNMEWMEVDMEISKLREQCFSYLKFWLNSIIIHTQRSEGMLAPILLIGTRKDRITEPAKHSKISRLLHKEFSNNIAISYIQQNRFGTGANGTATLMFFPVDNTLSDKDPMIESIMSTIERCLDEADYPHLDIPISWIKVYDQLKVQSKSSITLSTMKEMVNQYISHEELIRFLKFLHELGLLMWHQEETLSKQIILDPIEYFVTPATTIICRHIPSDEDETVHVKPIHTKCQQLYFDEWISLVQKGILSHRLLIALLQDYSHYEKIIVLLIKYSLIVSLSPVDYLVLNKTQDQQHEIQAVMQNCKYVVPALLPSQKENNIVQPFSKKKFSEKEKLYFIFTPNNMITDHLFNLSDCSKVGFLPSGLFERLLAKSVAWCIETSAYEVGSRDGVMNWNYQDYHFDRSEAFLSYGNQFFILKLELEYNAISLIIDGPNKKWIYDRVLEQLQSMISECMDCLEVVCGLSWKHSLNPVCLEDEYDDNDQSISEEEDATTKLEDRKIASIEEEATKIKEAMKDCLLKYESIEQCITNSKYLNFSMHGKVYQIPSMNLQTNYEFWMKRRNALDKYDIFISYRWGGSHHHFDSNLAKGIFDGLSGRLVDNPKRSIETFLDIQRLQEGRRFDADFSRALSNSLIFVPLVSSYALTRMLHHDPMKVDNVLAEWIIGLDCYSRFENGTSMEYSIQLQRIYPIFIGSQKEEGDDANSQGTMKNLFEESILDELPKVVPVATIEMIEKNLNRPLLPVYKVVTVHEVVNTLKKFLCINAFEIVHGSVLTNKLIPCCFVRLSKSLRGLLVEIQAQKNEKNDIIIEKNDIALETTESDFFDEQSTFTIDFECLAALYLSEKIDECQAIVRYGRKLLSQSQKIVAHKLYFLYCLELINFTSLFSENIRIPIQKLMDTFTPSRDWGQRKDDNVSIIESKSAKENGRGAFSSTVILTTPTEVIQGTSKDRLEVEWTMISMIDRVIEIHSSQNLVEAAVDLLPTKDLEGDRLHKELKQMKQQLSSARQDLQQAQENLEKKSQVTIPVAVMEENAEIINLKKQIEMVVNEYQEIEKNLIETTKSLQAALVERELYKRQIKDWTKQFQVENGREPEVNDKALIRDKFQIYKNITSKVKEFEGIVQPLEKEKKEKALQIQQLEKQLEKQLVLIAGPLEAGGHQRLSSIDPITVASVTAVENCKPEMTDIAKQQFEEIMQKHNEVLEQLDNQIFDLKEQLSKLKLVNQEIETEKNFINQQLQALIKEKRTDVLKRFEDELAELNKKSTELNETVTRLTIDKEKLDTRVTELKERAESAEHELRERDAREQHSLQPNEESILLKEQIKKQRDQIILKSKAATAGWDAATLANDRLETEVQSAYQKGLKEEREKHKLDGIHEALEGKETRITELLVSIAEMEKKVMKTESEKKAMEEYIEDLKSEVAIAISGIQQIAAANICGGTGDGHLKQNGELVILPSAAELEQAHEQLDAAHEELVGLMDRCDRLEAELEISRRKNRLFERLATMTGLTSGKAATVVKSGDSHPELSKYDLGDVVQSVKRAITKGTNLWKSNLKDQCYDVYLDACVEITQRIISEDLLKPVFDSIERGKSLGAQNRQRGAVLLRKALDKFIADAALPNYKNNEETAVANARAKTNQSSAIDEENEISNATVKELVERLENMESSFIKQGYTKENNPSNSSAAGTEEQSPRENQSGASLLLRAKTAEAEVQSLRKQLALIISASTPSTGTIAGVGVAKADNGDECNFAEVQDLQYKIRFLEKQLKNWRKDPLPYWEKVEDCISLQKCLQFFLDYLQNKTAFQSEVQAISFKFKQSPSLIPNHLKVHDKLPVHRIEKEEANQSSSHSLQKQFLQLHQKLEKLNNSSSVEVLEIASTIEGKDSSEKKLKNEINSLKRERKSIEMRAVKAENSLQKIEETYNTIVSERDTLKSENAKLVETKNERENVILEKLSKESILRKKYKNELEDLKGSIRVYARCRPMAKYELEKGCRNMVEFKDETSMKLITSRGEKEFEFDAVFSPSSTQEQIFEETKRLMESCMDGFNIAMFAYGQTGAGKTFTMTGSPSSPGLTPRAIDELFRLIGERVHLQVKVTSYFVELYNDNIVDLFYILDKGSSTSSSSDPPKLEVKMDARKIVYIQNAVIKDVNSPEELMELFNKGNSERHVAATKMNSESSRSHTIFAIMIESYDTTSKRTTIGKLSLVDLAGSERANKTGASADRLKEAQSINKSLSALGDVIAALSEGEKFIPYRNNKLTQLMQDSLGGNAKTLMFVNFSPADYNVDETSTSLLYAARVKKIVNNPSKQAESEEVARLKAIIKRLQSGQAVALDELDKAEAVEDAPVEKADDGKGYDGY